MIEAMLMGNNSKAEHVYLAANDYVYKYKAVNGVEVWSVHLNTDSDVYSLSVDKESVVYAGTSNGDLFTISEEGVLVKYYSVSSSAIRCITHSNDRYIYYTDRHHTGEDKVVKANKNDLYTDWSYLLPGKTNSIALDNLGHIYIGIDDRGIHKNYASTGDRIDDRFVSDSTSDIDGVATDANNDIYHVANGPYTHSIKKSSGLTGEGIWSYSDNERITCMTVGSDKCVYYGTEVGDVVKLNTNGTLSWRVSYHSDKNVYSIAVDSKGNVYSTGGDYYLRKLDSLGQQIWSERRMYDLLFAVAVDSGMPGSGFD